MSDVSEVRASPWHRGRWRLELIDRHGRRYESATSDRRRVEEAAQAFKRQQLTVLMPLLLVPAWSIENADLQSTQGHHRALCVGGKDLRRRAIDTAAIGGKGSKFLTWHERAYPDASSAPRARDASTLVSKRAIVTRGSSLSAMALTHPCNAPTPRTKHGCAMVRRNRQ